MPAPFDADLHLRMALEMAILEPGDYGRNQGPGGQTALWETVSALVAIGVIDKDRGEGVLLAQDQAMVLRGKGDQHPMRHHFEPPQGDPEPLRAPHVVVCDQEITQPWGTLIVAYVAFDTLQTSLVIRATENTPGGLMSNFGGIGPPSAVLTDDQGRSETAHFSGGGGGSGGYSGRLTTAKPLSPTTQWIDLPNARLDLSRSRTVPEGQPRLEDVPINDPALWYLWQRLAAPARHRHMFTNEPVFDEAIHTFELAGALDPDDPELAKVQAVRAALSNQSPGTASLPEPWAAYLANIMREGGPEGVVGIGQVTEAIDGVIVSFEGLTSQSEGFTLHVKGSPSLGMMPIFFSELGGPRLTWWAHDDRGSVYLGGIGSSGGGRGFSEGTIEFTPALDPKATELVIEPTGPRHRAVVTVRLGPWKKQA